MLCNPFVFLLFILKKITSERDVHSYFSVRENESQHSRISISEIIIAATDNASQAEVYMAK